MNMLDAFREVEKRDKTFVWASHPNLPGIKFMFDNCGKWVAVKNKEPIDVLLTLEDVNDFSWEVSYK